MSVRKMETEEDISKEWETLPALGVTGPWNYLFYLLNT